jgi:uncharacterized protein YqjF (DUF2071 family)
MRREQARAVNPADVPPEPVTATTPRPLRAALMRQQWRDLAMLHWEVPIAAAARFMPPGVRPDTFEGRTYVGLIPFRMVGAGLGSAPGVPFFGTFLETNVRLYSVDEQGRRGIVFRSLDADRLAVVLGARLGLGLPYVWSRLGFRAAPDAALAYATLRRRGGVRSRLVVRPGDVIERPGGLEAWLTGRWGLHTRLAGATRYLTNEHEVWPLHRAEVLALDDGLVAAAGLGDVAARPPDSVLWSPGVRAAFGPV